MSLITFHQSISLNELNHFFFLKISPAVVILAFCYSINSDISMLLRSNGTFSTMILNHDLKVITGNPLAEMNHVQKALMAQIGLMNI